jgi:hypothetical protein
VKWKPELVSAPNFTGWLGRNLRLKGFGVFSTWMKTERAQRGARRRRVAAARMVRVRVAGVYVEGKAALRALCQGLSKLLLRALPGDRHVASEALRLDGV